MARDVGEGSGLGCWDSLTLTQSLNWEKRKPVQVWLVAP